MSIVEVKVLGRLFYYYKVRHKTGGQETTRHDVSSLLLKIILFKRGSNF